MLACVACELNPPLLLFQKVCCLVNPDLIQSQCRHPLEIRSISPESENVAPCELQILESTVSDAACYHLVIFGEVLAIETYAQLR